MIMVSATFVLNEHIRMKVQVATLKVVKCQTEVYAVSQLTQIGCLRHMAANYKYRSWKSEVRNQNKS